MIITLFRLQSVGSLVVAALISFNVSEVTRGFVMLPDSARGFVIMSILKISKLVCLESLTFGRGALERVSASMSDVPFLYVTLML